jgi:hypothetical protein
MNKEKAKKVYMYIEEREPVQTLYLTDEQAAVFKWLGERGYDIDVKRIDEQSPEEIIADEYNFWLGKQ